MVDSVSSGDAVLEDVLAFVSADIYTEAGVARNGGEVSGSRQGEVFTNFGISPDISFRWREVSFRMAADVIFPVARNDEVASGAAGASSVFHFCLQVYGGKLNLIDLIILNNIYN